VRKFRYTPALKMVAYRVPIRHKAVVFHVPEEMRGKEFTPEMQKQLEQYRRQQHTIELEKEGTKLKQIVYRDVGIVEYNNARDEYLAKLKSIGVDPMHVGKIERH
jgi:hypothetical protein